MSTFKRAKVIMLPAKEKAENCLILKQGVGNKKLEYHKQYFTQEYLQQIYAKAFHLYIISDEEIKEGDWIYSKEPVFGSGNIGNVICQYDNRINYSTDFGDEIKLQKIIATTDSSLFVKNTDMYSSQGLLFLPQPSESFIQKYVEEHNKGNVITDVMVEHEITKSTVFINNNVPYCSLKVSKDNTITIKKVKDSYTRAEVIDITLKSFSVATQALILQKDIDVAYNEFIENNL
jgi:hypothetical protein